VKSVESVAFLFSDQENAMSTMEPLDTDPLLNTLTASGRQGKLFLESTIKVDFGAVTHAGKVRINNEDHYLVGRLGRSLEPLMTNLPTETLPENVAEYGYGLLVADGMGGAAAGEVASRMAVSSLVNLIIETAKWGRRIDEEEAQALMERLEGYYSTIHAELVRQGEVDPAVTGMGTTLTIAYSFYSDLFIAHVGDSRAYLFRNGQLSQLTHDHTMAQKLADEGDIPQEAVATHKLRHVLTNVLGGHRGPVVTELEQLQLADGDRLLLCSDGLTDMVDDDTIAAVLRETGSPQEASQKLLDLALNAGGKDNITIVMARYIFSQKRSEASP
jgi:PPM family protein phosphatase